MAGWKKLLPLLAPLLCAALLGWWFFAQKPAASGPSGTAPLTPGESWQAVDFSALPPGGTIPGWDVNAGNFQLQEKDGRTVLALLPEPMGEGSLRSIHLIRGSGGVRARMTGERTRRARPRFAVSLEDDRAPFMLRAVPATGAVEITTAGEQVLATVPWTWDPAVPLWLELRVRGSEFTGRVWKEGEARPDNPSVACTLPAPPGLLRAAIQGAPYAYRSIVCDRIELLR